MIETTELYGGEIGCEFDAARHTYTIVNKGRRYKVPSVTKICAVLDKSGPLMGWAINNTLEVCRGAIAPGCEYAETYLEAVWDAAKKQSRSVKDTAADRGKRLHQLIESSFKQSTNPEIELSDSSERLRVATSIATWLGSLGVDAIRDVEKRIYSRRHRYSGTLDAVVRSKEGSILIDWKTGKSIYPEFRLQTAAYVHAYEEEFPDQRIEGRYLVRIAEDGSIDPHYYPRSTLRLDFKGFLGAKSLFDRIEQIKVEDRKSLKTKANLL